MAWIYESAAEMSQALAGGEVSAMALTEAAIARVEACDGPINAICVKTYEAARQAARAADARLAKGERGPLLGVPMTVKESFNLAGTPTTWGFPAARDYLPAEDALAVQRVKAAGAVIIGKTNVPVALADWQSYNSVYGVTNNPYDLSCSPGGSSGGSSAALAAGFGALSLGSDIGGSLRVPAHFCGIFAHKPTHNLVPPRGSVPPFVPALPGSIDLSVIGPMARTAADLAALFEIIAGPDDLDDGVGYRLGLPAPRATKLGEARILVIGAHPLAATDDPIAAALETLADGLANAGAKVSRASPLLPDLADGARLYMRLLYATLLARAPEESRARVSAEAARLDAADTSLQAERLRGGTVSFSDWVAANARRQGLRAKWRALFREFDAVICPIFPTAAYPHDHTPDQEMRRLIVNGEPQSYVDALIWPGVATLPGLPATAVPIGRTPQGLPIAAQIIGPWLEDRTTLELAGMIEREFGGFVPPPL